MAQPDLTSDHVNYLIWRYLQESGHGEAAVALQRAWYPDPQSLPFARHIKTHALVSLVQKGLEYHELESSIDKEGNPVNVTPANQFFGPEPFDAAALKSRAKIGTDHPAPESARDRATNGHAPETGRRRRPANGASTEIDTKTESKSGSPILDQLDTDGDVNMDEPQESTINVGTNVGVQIPSAKAVELTTDTAFLNTDHHVVDTLWRPKDPTVLVTRSETQCDLWKFYALAPFERIKLQDSNSGAYVTAVAWDSVGDKLAVASTRDTKGTITMYDANGGVSDMFPDLPRVVTGLHWADHAPKLVIVLSDDRSSELALLDGAQSSVVFPPSQLIEGPIYDLSWAGEDTIFACGDGVVYQFEATHNIRLVKEHKSMDTDIAWTFLRCTQTASGPVAVVANPRNSLIWIPTHDIHIENPQQGPLSGIDLRPQSPAQSRSSATSITIVSHSIDGSAHMWNVDLELKEYKHLNKFKVGSGKPALAAGFSPDGYALGAVSEDQIYIWNAERDENPAAIWECPSWAIVRDDIDHPTNGHNGHISSPLGALSWDPDGKKLAYAFDKKLAIVDLFSKNE